MRRVSTFSVLQSCKQLGQGWRDEGWQDLHRDKNIGISTKYCTLTSLWILKVGGLTIDPPLWIFICLFSLIKIHCRKADGLAGLL